MMIKGLIDKPWITDLATSLPPEEIIFGRTAAMREIHDKVRKIADTKLPVLVGGESGTGKEVIAKFMHVRSVWGSGAFVKVHCPAIPESLLENELFESKEGDFTGTNVSDDGRTEPAIGGTPLFDEIAELGPGAQAKLLQVLEDGQIFRIGLQDGKRAQVRVVCSTHRPVEQSIRNGTFRPDLFYRINVVTLNLPTLRERREDLPALTYYFLQLYSRKNSRPLQPLSNFSLQLLQESDWPGNIRELENLINRYVILGSEDIIAEELLGGQSERSEPGQTDGSVLSLRRIARQAARAAERKVILEVLNASHGNRKKTARLLNISYRSLLYKIKDAGIPRKEVHDRPV